MSSNLEKEQLMNLSFQKVFFGMACMAGLFIVLFYGSTILIPFSQALLISFILYPICTKLESWGIKRIPTAITVILVISLLMSGLVFLLSSQIVSIVDDLSSFEMKLKEVFDTSIKYFNKNVSLIPNLSQDNIIDKGEDIIKKSGGSIMTTTLSQTSSIFSGALMTLIYTFLLLIYRGGLKKVAQNSAKEAHRKAVGNMVDEMQKIGQSYLFGMAIMISILGAANSIVLLSFGLDNAVFFGVLAALLAIVPYVGTTIGAGIPIIYSFMTLNSLWIPLGIMGAFGIIQLIESNYLSPRIVGGKLNINALAAIISLLIGGYLWGIAGMILFLPFTAIFKVFCSYFKQLESLSLLIGEELKD